MFSFFKADKSQRATKKSVLEENIQGVALKYKKHHASKCIKISLRENAPVLVTLPRSMSFARAQEFAHSKLGWIKDNVKSFAPPFKYPAELERLRREAKEYLPKRLEQLALEHGFKYRKVTVKNLKTRWGSCSFLNNINLNLNLMRFEADVIDYVLLHELCHTVEKNHSKKFWALLESHLPRAQELRKKLKA